MSTSTRDIKERLEGQGFPTSLVKQASFQQGRNEQARTPAQKYVDSLISVIAAKGDVVQLADHRIKSIGSCLHKAIYRRDGDVTQIPDGLGLRITYRDPQTILNARKVFSPGRHSHSFHVVQENRDIRLLDFQDNYAHPSSSTGRTGINIRLRNGKEEPAQGFEVQLIHENMLATECLTHPFYKMIADINSNANLAARALTEDEKQITRFLKSYTSAVYDLQCWENNLMQLRSATPAHTTVDAALAAIAHRESASNHIVREYQHKKLDPEFIERASLYAESVEMDIADAMKPEPAQSAQPQYLLL